MSAGSATTIASSRARGLRRAAALALFLPAGWLASSYVAALAVVHRWRPRASEPAPSVDWAQMTAVRLATADGEDVSAWLASVERPRAAVVLVHGLGGSASASLGRARVLARLGCSSLLLSLRAHGDSSGERIDFGPGAKADVEAAVAWLEARVPGTPIVVDGCSLGAAAAAFAAPDLGSRVRGWVFECLFADLDSAIANRCSEFLPPLVDAIAHAGLCCVAPLVIGDLEEIAPCRVVGCIPQDVPVLVLAAGHDRKVSPRETRAIADALGGRARVVMFDDAGHDRCLSRDPARWEREVERLIASVAP